MDLRARPGREQVNSHLGKCPFASFVILRNVCAFHNRYACLKVILRAVIPRGGTDVVGEDGHPMKIGDRTRLHVQALQGKEGEGKGDRLPGGEEFVDERERRELSTA